MRSEVLYRIALKKMPHIGDITARELTEMCGTAEELFRNVETLQQKTRLKDSQREFDQHKKAALESAERELQFIEKYKIKALLLDDAEYPERLKQCADAPTVLFYRGNADLNSRKIISIIGTRNATEYGKQICEELLSGLVPFQPIIVSGLALGIDGLAHKEALRRGLKTIGVLGHGLDRIYPHAHRSLAKKMIEQGGLLSDYCSGSNADKENFPKRNRIVAGISEATIVLEAGIPGGALITADLASGYGREVFAFPGRSIDPYSAGCNLYIKNQKASLVENAADLVFQLGWSEIHPAKKALQANLFQQLSDAEKKIVAFLDENGEAGIDNIAYGCGMSMGTTSGTLLEMEFKRLIRALPGKRFRRA